MSKRAVITGTVAGALLAAVVLVGLLIADHFKDQREKAELDWRFAVESKAGIVTDWDAYRDMWVDRICHRDDISGYFDTATAGGTSVDVLRTNVSYACPDRMPELEEWAHTARATNDDTP